jgi:hypothetical protein
MLWSGREPFFSNLKTFLGKWTFINVHFLKKSFKSGKTMHMHISSMRRTCRYVGFLWCNLYFYNIIYDHMGPYIITHVSNIAHNYLLFHIFYTFYTFLMLWSVRNSVHTTAYCYHIFHGIFLAFFVSIY